MRTQKPSVKLEDWAVVTALNTRSYDELRPGNLLVGRAFGHQKIENGTFIFTSAILHIDSKNKIVETRNTLYCLGETSYEYTAWRQQQTRGTAA
jgi:hypothetical protein